MIIRESSPVYISVESTSYPISNIAFPAVTICSVNKLEEHRLIEALAGIQKDKNEYVMIKKVCCWPHLSFRCCSFDSVDEQNLMEMLEAIIRFESADLNGTVFKQAEDFAAADLLKIFKSVSTLSV